MDGEYDQTLRKVISASNLLIKLPEEMRGEDERKIASYPSSPSHRHVFGNYEPTIDIDVRIAKC